MNSNKYWQAGQLLLKTYNIKVVKWRTVRTGRACIKTRTIATPKPTGKISFLVFAHEVGHIVLGEIRPRHLEELKAEQWAMATARSFGFKVPRKYLQRARRYVAYKSRQALRRNAKRIEPEVKEFIKRGGIHV